MGTFFVLKSTAVKNLVSSLSLAANYISQYPFHSVKSCLCATSLHKSWSKRFFSKGTEKKRCPLKSALSFDIEPGGTKENLNNLQELIRNHGGWSVSVLLIPLNREKSLCSFSTCQLRAISLRSHEYLTAQLFLERDSVSLYTYYV